MEIDSFTEALFNLTASVLIDPAYTWENLESAIRDALIDAFSFAKRDFGQSASGAEVMAVIHGIKGITAVDLDELYRLDESGGRVGESLAPVLRAQLARAGSDEEGILPAELLLINEGGIALTEMES